jgi:hypothetical protein
MVAQISTGSALYYPYIHPRKSDHLKSALLYWDRIRRIVPNMVINGLGAWGDDDDTLVLADHGLLIATQPNVYEEKAAERFFEHLESRAGKFQLDLETAKDLAGRNRGIHIEKLGFGIIERLKDLGLAHQFGDWVSMHDEVGAFYMFCLASEMSSQMSSPLLTDSPAETQLGESLLFESNGGDELTEVLYRVGIKLPSPDKLHNVPMSQVASFAAQRAPERKRFREAIEGIIEKVRSTHDANAIDDYLETQKIEIEEAINDMNRTVDELRVGIVTSVAKVTIPTGITALTGYILPISPMVAGILTAIGLSLGVVSCYAETRGKLRQARTSAPYHYLTSIETDLLDS